MTLYAFDDIDDAITATREFLLPFDLGRWAKLALVMFFIGGVGGFNPLQFTSGPSSGDGGDAPGDPGTFPDLGAEFWTFLLIAVGILVVIGLLFLLVGSVMEFVFVESLRNERVRVRRYWGQRWGQGLRLFGFRLVLGLLVGGIVLAVALAAFAPVIFGDGNLSVPLVLLAIGVFLVLAVVGGLVQGFTTVFVVPVMIAEDLGVLAAWGRFWPTMAGQWKQYATYAIMGFVLQLAAGLLVSILMVVLAILVAIPFVPVGLLGAGLLAVSSIAGWVVIGLVVLLYLLAIFVVGLFVTVPVQAFLRYYALLVLGDTNKAFDLVAERRRAIRGDGEGSPA